MENIDKVVKPKKKRNGIFHDIAKNKFSYIIALPAIIYVFIFSYCAYPYILIAFQRFNYQNNNIFDIIFKGNWVGFDNFKFFFTSQNASRVIFNTFFLNILFILTGTILSLMLALFLNELRSKKFVKVTQSIMLFPNYISWIVVSYILFSLLSNEYGLINKALENLGMQPVNWYAEADVWPGILVALRAWKGAGMSAIIFLAAIASIDTGMYEAAQIDGANRFQQMFKITIPLILPTVIIMTLLSVGKIMFGDFGMIYALVGDNGVLYSTTDIIDTYIFRALRQIGDPAQAMAIGLFQSAIGFVMVFGSNWITRKVYPDGALY